jgi:hypothetical protein
LLAIVVKRWMGAIPVRADSGLRRLDSLHQGQGARPSQRFTGRARSASALRASYQTMRGAASGIGNTTSRLRRSGIDSAQTNLDLALGTPERDNSAARRAAASQDARFRQASDGARCADAAFQELLQLVPETRHIEGEDASASRWPERPLLDDQGITNLQRCNHFKDRVGSTDKLVRVSILQSTNQW